MPDLSFMETMPANCAVQFLDRARKKPDAEAFRFPVGEEWKSLTWAESELQVTELAAGLLALGIDNEDRVGIASSTRIEWVLADLAIMCAGAATTTVYPSTNAEEAAFILRDSGSRVVFAEDAEQVKKLTGRRDELSEVVQVVVFEGAGDGDWVLTMDELRAKGREYLQGDPDGITAHSQAIKPDQLATLIYTSGTTGRPKGVRLSHRAWVYEGEAIASQKILGEDDVQFLWLPLAHCFGKVLLSLQMSCGFVTAVDGRVDKIIDNLAVVRPTFMGAAPRIFEKAHGRIQTMQENEGGLKYKLFTRAFAVGLEADRLEREGKKVPAGLKAQRALFDKLVFSKIRDRFGGRVRFFISGSAALNQEIAEWFNVAGITILEGYGLTETSAGTFVNRPWANKFGTVGPPIDGTEVSIAADGEVLVKGPAVMEGYHNLPDVTAEVFTEDGWFKTGDIGEVDADGHLRITDRKKDLFKTSGGKYIAPSMIESQFKAICPYASQFLVHGNERNYCVALIALDPDAMTEWAANNGMEGASYSEIVTSDQVRMLIAGYVEELNKRLNRWETIKKHVILTHDLTVESGELTPSMKVKRKVVEANHKETLDELYS